MQRMLVVDLRFAPMTQEHLIRDTLLRECANGGLTLQFAPIEGNGSLHDHDLIPIVSAGSAIVSVVVGLISLLRRPKKQWTHKVFLDEMTAYLRLLEGGKDVEIVSVEGFDRMVTGSRSEPCIVHIRDGDGGQLKLYVGIHDDRIVLASVHYDDRQF